MTVSFTDALAEILEAANDAGIPAVGHARDIHTLPAAIIAPENFSFNRLGNEAYGARFAAYLVAADTGHGQDALAALSDLAQKFKETFGSRNFEMVAISLPNMGADPYPALKTELNLNVRSMENV